MSTFSALTCRRLKAQVFEALPKAKWFSFVVDETCLHVVSTHLKLSDLLDYNISVVEPLEQRRKPCKDGVYFISPTRNSVQRLCDDFSGARPLYDNAYVFFSSKASDSAKNLIKQCPALVSRLKVLKEVHTEYECIEDRTFSTGQPTALATFFGAHTSVQARKFALDQCAQRLCTAFVTLKCRPSSIVVRTPQDLPDVGLGDLAMRKSLCRDLGRVVQDRLTRWALYDPSLFTNPACDLVIVDRGHDPIAPAIHPFHYASMAHDLVDLKGGVFKYKWDDAKGQPQTSEHLVDSSDPMWEELRHAHIAEVGNTAAQRLKEFANSKLARVEREGAQNVDLGKATAGLPEYLQKKAHLSMHFSLTKSIFSEIKARDLNQLGSIEQALVFDEKKSSDLQRLMSQWNLKQTQGCPTAADKMRLLLCYLATHPGRFDDASRERWAQLAQLPPADMDTICNAQYIGVELKKAKRSKFTFMSGRAKKKNARLERTAADAQALENGRFQPMLADTVSALVNGTLQRGPDKEWDVVTGETEFDTVDAGGTAAASLGAKSRRTAKKPTWHKRGASGGTGAEIGVEQVGLRSRVVVIFVIGGCTWSEVQAAHELSSGVEIVLGSTHLIEGGDEFLQELAALSQPPNGGA